MREAERKRDDIDREKEEQEMWLGRVGSIRWMYGGVTRTCHVIVISYLSHTGCIAWYVARAVGRVEAEAREATEGDEARKAGGVGS